MVVPRDIWHANQQPSQVAQKSLYSLVKTLLQKVRRLHSLITSWRVDEQIEMGDEFAHYDHLLHCPCSLLTQFHVANIVALDTYDIALFGSLLELAAKRSRCTTHVESIYLIPFIVLILERRVRYWVHGTRPRTMNLPQRRQANRQWKPPHLKQSNHRRQATGVWIVSYRQKHHRQTEEDSHW